MCSQECQVQGMPQDWALLQGMPVQEEDQESQPSPSSTPE